MLTIQKITSENRLLLRWEEAQHNIRLANQLRPEMLIVTSKSVYTKLLKSLKSPPTSQKSLANLLQLYNVDWRKIYLLPRQTIFELSLWSFQYKILTNTLYLNDRLFKFGIAESPLCSQCTQEKESIIHLFVTCRVIHNLWERLCAWLSDLDIKLLSPLEPQFLILGIWNERLEDSSLVSLLILIFKRYIYVKKNDRNKQNIFSLRAFIKNIKSIERHITSQNGKLKYHYKIGQSLHQPYQLSYK